MCIRCHLAWLGSSIFPLPSTVIGFLSMSSMEKGKESPLYWVVLTMESTGPAANSLKKTLEAKSAQHFASLPWFLCLWGTGYWLTLHWDASRPETSSYFRVLVLNPSDLIIVTSEGDGVWYKLVARGDDYC